MVSEENIYPFYQVLSFWEYTFLNMNIQLYHYDNDVAINFKEKEIFPEEFIPEG